MSQRFIQQINGYVIKSLLEADDDEILSLVDTPNYPTNTDITGAALLIENAIQESKHERLIQKKAEFEAHKNNQVINDEDVLNRPVTTMLSDIVAAMQNKSGAVPEGMLVAFRNQQTQASDEEIVRMWKHFVELGLIEPTDEDPPL